jgi:subtilisin family serine protease
MAQKRYIIAPRPGMVPPGLRPNLRQAAVAGGAELIKSTAGGRHVARLDESAARALAAGNRNLIVEEDKPLRLARMPGLPPMAPQADGRMVEVRAITRSGDPLDDCSIYVLAGGVGYRGLTDARGTARIAVTAPEIEQIVASPRHSYWSTVLDVTQPIGRGHTEIVLDPLDAGAAATWIRGLLGLTAPYSYLTGNGVSVAVIDSGLAADVKTVHAAGGVNTLDGADPAAWTVDEIGHGSHCSGLVAAQPTATTDTIGIAPGASLYMAKVLPGGFVSDLVEALEWCIGSRVDIVSMSLGNPDPSEVLGHALDEAHEAGVTVFAATGNDASHVAFPAAHPTVIGVGAIGRDGAFPPESAHRLKVGRYRDWWGGLFNASFSNFGAEVAVCAPGVAIPSTVPGGYAAWDGTSMACPIVAGLAALVLEAFPGLRSQGPDALRWVLAAGAADMGLPREVQGYGLPTLPRLLAAAGGLAA